MAGRRDETRRFPQVDCRNPLESPAEYWARPSPPPRGRRRECAFSVIPGRDEVANPEPSPPYAPQGLRHGPRIGFAVRGDRKGSCFDGRLCVRTYQSPTRNCCAVSASPKKGEAKREGAARSSPPPRGRRASPCEPAGERKFAHQWINFAARTPCKHGKFW